MIFSTLLAAAAFVALPSSPSASTAQPRVQMASLFGKRRWVELPQQVQTEREYAPPAGRLPERAPEPLVPTRYMSPEQRALPIIVEPEPIYVTRSDTPAAPAPAQNDGEAQQDTGGEYQTPTPSYITSAPPTQEREGGEAATPAPTQAPAVRSGSATGSTATVNYGQPSR